MMGSIASTPYELKIYHFEDEIIASIELTLDDPACKSSVNVETVIIIDRSASMGEWVGQITHNILPEFFELLSYDADAEFHLIAFEAKTTYYKIKISDLKQFKLLSKGGTQMANAVHKLFELFTEFNDSDVTAVRILTISDGEVWDQAKTKTLGDILSEYASKTNISVNSQAIRFFTSHAQPDTTALCSLLQLNNVKKSNLTDVDASMSRDEIATIMANLFSNDCFDDAKILSCTDGAIFNKLPWDENTKSQLMIVPNRKNVFWLEKVPASTQRLTINGGEVKITVERRLTLRMYEELLSTKLDFIVDRIKILKIVDTESAQRTVAKIVEYFARAERKMMSLLPSDEPLDRDVVVEKRKKKISAFLATITDDNHVCNWNAAQKAEYLRGTEFDNSRLQTVFLTEKYWMHLTAAVIAAISLLLAKKMLHAARGQHL